jgi:glucosamine kinase
LTGETVKIMSVGEESATATLQELVRGAAEVAGVRLDAVERTCLGIAGSVSESVRMWGVNTLRGLVSGEILLVGDEEIALDAAFHGGPGILVIAGTGSNVIGRCTNGTCFTPEVGDRCWAMRVRANGLGWRRCALDCERRTAASKPVCSARSSRFWNLRDLGELVSKGNQRARPDFASLTKVVAMRRTWRHAGRERVGTRR